MYDKMKRVFAVIPVVALSLLMLAACGEAEREEATTPGGDEAATTATAVDTTSTWITGEQRAPIAVAEGGQTVIVSVDDNNIAIPETLVPGPAVFTVTNAGSKEHSLMVKAGETMVKQLDTPVQPAATASMNVDLPAGTYTVVCPIEGHDKAGEQRTLVVQAASNNS